jgi:hypothetical protein
MNSRGRVLKAFKRMPGMPGRVPVQFDRCRQLADDSGYGDVFCLNENDKIPMPNIDRIGKSGVIFTDAIPILLCQHQVGMKF